MNTRIPSSELNTEETLTLALSVYSGNFGTLFIPFLIGSLITETDHSSALSLDAGEGEAQMPPPPPF